MNPFVLIDLKNYLYANLDLAIFCCPPEWRDWYVTASYQECRAIFIQELWSEDESESFDGFNIISRQIKEAEVPDIEELFDEVRSEVLRNEYPELID